MKRQGEVSTVCAIYSKNHCMWDHCKADVFEKIRRSNTIIFLIGSVELCLRDPTVNSESLFLITFESGSYKYSQQPPEHFNFTTNYMQEKFLLIFSVGKFCFVNAVPTVGLLSWHSGAPDHTSHDGTGYMYLVDIDIGKPIIFRRVVHNLTPGILYEFSSYLTNVSKKKSFPLSLVGGGGIT